MLDLGCGGGEVTRLIAKLVGNSGRVVGVDREERAVARAVGIAEREGLSNVIYLQHDLDDPLPVSTPYDAIVARRVLMYLRNPGDVIRSAMAILRSGGLVVFQEIDSTMTPGRTVPQPLHDQVNAWIWSTIEAEGANMSFGFKLPALLKECSLNVEHVRADAEIEGYPSTMATIVAAMLPRIIHHLNVTESEVDIDTLERRLEDERRAFCSLYVRNMSFGVWARKP